MLIYYCCGCRAQYPAQPKRCPRCKGRSFTGVNDDAPTTALLLLDDAPIIVPENLDGELAAAFAEAERFRLASLSGSPYTPAPLVAPEPANVPAPSFHTLIMTCAESGERATTLTSLRACGWPEPEIIRDDQGGEPNLTRCDLNWLRTLQRAGEATTDFVLLCEDDVIFGRWFLGNLLSWPALKASSNGAFFASLYNPGFSGRQAMRRASDRHSVAKPEFAWGAQALVMTPLTARFLVEKWETMAGVNADSRMARLASALTPILYHVPSLVDHVGRSLWGGPAHKAVDFDPEWRADEAAPPTPRDMPEMPERKPYEAPTVRDVEPDER